MRYPPLWLQAGTYAAGIDRRLMGAVWPAAKGGATSGCAVSFKSGMTVTVDPGQIAVPTPNSTGTALCVSDAPEDVVVATAPGTGLGSRYDLVICQLRSTEMGDPANDDFVFTTETGVAAGTPTPPAVPAGAVALAQVYVAEGSANIGPANITDLRPHELGLQGFPGLDPLPASAPFQHWTDSTGEVWVAQGGVYGGAWHRARDVLFARVTRATALTASAGAWGAWRWDTVVEDAFGLWDGGYYLRMPVPGRWHFEACLSGVPAGGGQFWGNRVRIGQAPNATPELSLGQDNRHSSMTYGYGGIFTSEARVDFAGCLAGFESFTTITGPAQVGADLCHALMRYVGNVY